MLESINMNGGLRIRVPKPTLTVLFARTLSVLVFMVVVVILKDDMYRNSLNLQFCLNG